MDSWIPSLELRLRQRRKRIITIVLIAVVTFSAGIGIGYALSSYVSALNQGTPTILVQGGITPKNDVCRCISPVYVNFLTQDSTGITAFEVKVDHGGGDYSAYLPSDTTYYIHIGFLNQTRGTITECVPNPSSIFVPHFTNSQRMAFFNFSC